MIEALPALGDDNSPVEAGPPYDGWLLRIPRPFVVHRGDEVVARFRNHAIGQQIARGLGPEFQVSRKDA